MSAFVHDTNDITNLNAYNTVTLPPYDDKYKKKYGLDIEDLIALITSIHKRNDTEIKDVIKSINESIDKNSENKVVLDIEFIRYVRFLLDKYLNILLLLINIEKRENIQEGEVESCIYVSHENIRLINYKKIKDEGLKNSVELIVKVFGFLSEIKLDLKVSIDGKQIDIDGTNVLFKEFQIKSTDDLTKFKLNSVGGIRKNRRRKTSKHLKKRRKSSRYYRRR
jgi:hypothetical protein